MNDPILRKPTTLVTREELDYVRSVVPEMIDAMNSEKGAGLAANQAGISKRFFIMKDGDDKVKLVINPEIISMGDILPFEEGCLSIPGTSALTQRADYVKLKYLDENFNEIQEEYRGFSAAAVQHEVDHLDGKLYIDQLAPVRKMMTISKHQKYLKLKGRQR